MKLTAFNFCALMTILILGLPLIAEAASSRTQEIINRKNRMLSSPSREITAYKENALARYQSEVQRISKTDIEGVDNPDPTMSDSEEDADGSRIKKESHQASPQFSGERVFAAGFMGGAAYGVFGLDFEMGANENWAFGGGLGTGMTYSTWDLHGKYYFNSESKVNPFVQFGYANWNMRRVSRSGEKGRPQYLVDRFFSDKNGDITTARQRHLIYPGVGVLFLDKGGLGLSVQLIYLISLSNSVGALYGGAGFYLFF